MPHKAQTVNPQQELADLPDWVQRFHASGKPMKLDDLLPGEQNASIRHVLKTGGAYEYRDKFGQNRKLGVVEVGGYVFATAATITRRPTRSYDFVRDLVDFTASTVSRAQKIPVLYRIYHADGMANNGINKLAGLVSHEGRVYVKHAKKGKRKATSVKEELTRVIDFFLSHVNARPNDAPITGARGHTQITENGTRQALIEGSWIGFQYDHNVKIPSLDGKAWKLPMFIQSMSTEFIEVPEWSVGTGLEQFYWKPPRQLITRIRSTKDSEEKRIIQQAFPPELINELADSGRAQLPSERVMHVKHRGVDFEPFGESFLEPLMSDIAYMRALQQLDFVTIDSLVNRIVIIKVGSDDHESAYHNLETAELRVVALERVLGDPGPNMQILWAGPDIEVIEVGAHNSVLDIDGRHAIAVERKQLSMGIPRALLDGKEATGQIWAGYEGLREQLRAVHNNWISCWTSACERIAANNGYEDVELVYTPVRSMLADQTANADLALRAHKSGLASIRRTVAELGGNFDAERRNRIMEMGLDPDEDPDSLPPDNVIFAPPAGMPGDTRTDEDGNVIDPGGEPGRKPDSQREDIAPERPRENRNPKDGV